MTSPRVLIPLPIQDSEQRRFSLGKNYVNHLIAAGGLPILLPTTANALDDWRALYVYADGVMLTGGGDVDPSLFGEEAHPATYGIDRQRDEMEIALARWALQDDKPLFAICRGIQVMNVALGGSLVQDLPTQWAGALPHSGSQHGLERHEPAHSISVEPGTRLAQVLGAAHVQVNSFHHQAINRLAEGLRITARAADGVIEAVEFPNKRYYLGVQWHPEDMAAQRADMMRLFSAFVAACRA